MAVSTDQSDADEPPEIRHLQIDDFGGPGNKLKAG